MKANFRGLRGTLIPDEELDQHANWLAAFPHLAALSPPRIGTRTPPKGYEDMVTVDVFGTEFVWMNLVFPREHYEWYLWFESVFLVPPEMATFLRVRWA